MDFITYSLLACLLGGPIAVFSVKPDAPSWIRSGKLLFPVFLLFLILNYTSPLYECLPYKNNGCWSFKLIFLSIALLEYTMYLGWFEYIWRRWHKQISWPLKENFKYGAISNIVLVISGFMTLIVMSVLFINNVIPLLAHGN